MTIVRPTNEGGVAFAARRDLAAGRPLRSLAWAGDDLIDWIGGTRITLEGAVSRFGSGYTYRFDGAAGLGDVGVTFETLGTKGRLVRANGQLAQQSWVPLGFDELRELDRSYYHATDYGYPVCLLTLPDGRAAIAHCPRCYDTLELELLDGTPLTRRPEPAEDVFHARLAASPDGRWLLSNGWVWQPWRVACVYDVARALREPAHLSSRGIPLELGGAYEVEGAVLSADRVILSALDEDEGRAILSIVELPSGKNLACIALAEPLGTQLVAWGPEHVVALDGRPRVVALASGEVVETLAVEAEIAPRMEPSVSLGPPQSPYVAIDPLGPRFAVGDAGGAIRVFTRAPA